MDDVKVMDDASAGHAVNMVERLLKIYHFCIFSLTAKTTGFHPVDTSSILVRCFIENSMYRTSSIYG